MFKIIDKRKTLFINRKSCCSLIELYYYYWKNLDVFMRWNWISSKKWNLIFCGKNAINNIQLKKIQIIYVLKSVELNDNNNTAQLYAHQPNTQKKNHWKLWVIQCNRHKNSSPSTFIYLKKKENEHNKYQQTNLFISCYKWFTLSN